MNKLFMARIGSFLSLVLLLALLLVASGAEARHIVEHKGATTIIYVDADATGANDGTSWTDAYNELQSALIPATAGDELWVAEGTYKPADEGNRLAFFKLQTGVAIYGGFDGTETAREQRDWEANVTILSGDLSGNDNDNIDTEEPTRAENSLHVLLGDQDINSSAVLDGFTITGGNSNEGNPDGDGGGLYLLANSSPTLRNLIFLANSADDGGAMVILNGGNATFTNVTFTNNFASDEGGAISNHHGNFVLDHVYFINNSAQAYGGAIFNWSAEPTISNSSFSNNSAAFGGGIANRGNSLPIISHSTFSSNQAQNDGGGMYNESSSPQLYNVIFRGNAAFGEDGDPSDRGGGMFNSNSSVMLNNVLLTGNRAQENGGAIFNDQSTTTLNQVTISGNLALLGGGIANYSTFSVSNSIIWHNQDSTGTGSAAQIYNANGGSVSASYSLVQGGWTGTGNIDSDPLFVSPINAADAPTTAGDFHLQSTSPALDAADNDAVPPDTIDLDQDEDTTEPLPIELDGSPRFVDSAMPDTGNGTPPIVDMGAYELNEQSFTPTPTTTATNSPTASNTSTATATHTASPSPTPSNTPDVSSTPTNTPPASATASNTPSPSSTPTHTATATQSATVTSTNTPSATASNTPTASPTASNTPTASATATNMPSSLTLEPNSAVANAGNVPIVIHGEAFEEPVTAELGGVPLLSVTLETSSLLHAVVPVESLGIGVYDLTVNSNGSLLNLPAAFTVTTAPPPTQFLAMIYMACDNNLFSSCRRLFNKLEVAMLQNPDLRIVVLWDGINHADSAYYVIEPDDNPFDGPEGEHYEDYVNRFPLQELDSASPATLVNFAAWAKSQYPGEYSFLSLVGHGDGWAPDLYPAQIDYKWDGGAGGMLWDDDPGNTMSTKALAEALDWITDGGQIDVIYLDACLMGTIEVMAELAPYAEYLVAHENLTWATYPYDLYLSNVNGNTEPAELAHHIAQTAFAEWPDAAHPGQVSVINSSQLDDLLAKLDTFAQSLSNALASNPTLLRPIIQDAALSSAHVDENRDWAINPGDSALVLYHFASLLSTHPQITETALINTAQDLMVAFDNVVEDNFSQSDTPWPGSEYWDLSNLRGLSLYFPLNDEWKRAYYNTDGLPRFATASAWDEFVHTWHDTGSGRGGDGAMGRAFTGHDMGETILIPPHLLAPSPPRPFAHSPTRSSVPEPPTELCPECLIPPMHIALTIEAPSSALVGSDPIWVPIELVNVEQADDLRGVQLTIEVSDNSIVAPAGDLSARAGDLLPPDTAIQAASTSNGWQILFTTEALSGTGTIVELPFYGQKEGSVQLSFSQDKLKDGTPADIEHYTITDWLGVGDRSTLAGIARLESRLPGAHEGITVTLNGPRQDELTMTPPTGGFTLPNILRDTYTIQFNYPFFLYHSQTVTVDEPITIEPVTLCAGDMDSNGTINQRDAHILNAGIIPVALPTFDLNGDGETDVGDAIILERNLDTQAPHNCAAAPGHHNGSEAPTRPLAHSPARRSSPTRLLAVSLPVQNQAATFTLAAQEVSGTIAAVGILFKLPTNSTINHIELIAPFTGGFLEWQQEEDTLYLVAAPPEDVTLTEDTEIMRIHLNIPQETQSITIDIEAANQEEWMGELVILEGTANHNIYLPILQR